MTSTGPDHPGRNGPGEPSADRLGTGWPSRPSPIRHGALDWLSGAALVRQSIRLILDTEPGERVMRPDFGCGLRRYLMDPNTPATRAQIALDVQAALHAWEPRIVVGPWTSCPATIRAPCCDGHLHVTATRASTPSG